MNSKFLKLLEDMEGKNEKIRNVSGETKGPFDSKAAYGYTVKLGIEKNNFPFRRGFHPRPRPLTHVRSIGSKNVAAEQEIDVFDEGDIERDISVSDGREIKEASFKNGILEIKIKKE
ncbi:MAG: hypothetical protein MUO43_17595 [Desulfobacterales bacterium]|nr:hypothetical protein [Desulfobacterales bacterium]